MKKVNFTLLSMAVAMASMMAFAPTAMAKAKKKSASNPQVIYTGEIAKKVIGYNGTTPVNITITNGKITNITAEANKETPAYFNKAKEKVFKQFIGKTVEEAQKLDADVATGATYSSDALIKNIKMGLQQAKGKTASKAKDSNKGKAKSKGKKRMGR